MRSRNFFSAGVGADEESRTSTSASEASSSAGASVSQPSSRPPAASRKSRKFMTAADVGKSRADDQVPAASAMGYFHGAKTHYDLSHHEVAPRGLLWPLRRPLLQCLTQPMLGRAVATLATLGGTAMPAATLLLHERLSVAPPLRKPQAFKDVSSSSGGGGGGKAEPPLSNHILRHRTNADLDTISALTRHASPSITVGRSRIHSRGIHALRDIPRGTRILTVPSLHFADPLSFVLAISGEDARKELGAVWRYVHLQGGAFELPLTPHLGLLFNHSCAANVTCGLSRSFWPLWMMEGGDGSAGGQLATAARVAELRERAHKWAYFNDPNSFFTTRDVAAGEELTLDYSTRVAPMFEGELRNEAFNPLLCNCGASQCRGFIYHGAQQLAFRNVPSEDAVPQRLSEILVDLGVDDELVLLSLLRDRGPLFRYLNFDNSQGGFCGVGSNSGQQQTAAASKKVAATPRPEAPMQVKRFRKRFLQANFVYTLAFMNAIPPMYNLDELTVGPTL